MPDERPHFRASARTPVALVVRFRRDDPRSMLEHNGRTTDVSMAGVFVECEKPPTIGTRLVMTLVSPTAWEPLAISVEVRWVSDGSKGRVRGFGALFDGLGKTQAAALFELLQASAYLEAR